MTGEGNVRGQRTNHKPVVSEEIDKYRPPLGRQFPKMTKFNGKGVEDHNDKYELLITGLKHCEIMLFKLFKTYL